MATPDTEHQSTEVEWSIQPAYRYEDNDSTHRCALTGFPQRKGEVVYRGPHIDEFYGFMTIGQDAAEQLARLIGWIDPDDLVMTPDELLEQELLSLREQVAELESQLDAVREVAK